MHIDTFMYIYIYVYTVMLFNKLQEQKHWVDRDLQMLHQHPNGPTPAPEGSPVLLVSPKLCGKQHRVANRSCGWPKKSSDRNGIEAFWGKKNCQNTQVFSPTEDKNKGKKKKKHLPQSHAKRGVDCHGLQALKKDGAS